MSIGENIKQKRLAKGLTTAEVAKRIGASKQYVGQVERGLKTPSLGFVIEIADLFICTVDEMLGRNVS